MLVQCANAFATPQTTTSTTATTATMQQNNNNYYNNNPRVFSRAALIPQQRVSSRLLSTSTDSTMLEATPAPQTAAKTLTLLTFDLDDTLYPIAPVIEEANVAFAKAMERFGFGTISPSDIDQACKDIRSEADQDGSFYTHTQVREMAIRREMERVVFERKLQETADDWATQVSDLADLVTRNAKKWAHAAVSDSIVNAVLTAWEMERHHAAERNLYPEVVDVLKQIKEDHPDVIIGAVTDGKANPMFMTFTLGPYFDFCTSWEDDQGGRSQFFQELDSVDGRAQLTWIYNFAFEKYKQLASAKVALKNIAADPTQQLANNNDEDQDALSVWNDNSVWIHAGDDLFYDVGGSASCGAKTIYVDLADRYGQTARDRFVDLDNQPAWSTSTRKELETRKIRNEESISQVDETINFLTLLPEAIDRILHKTDSNDAVNGAVSGAVNGAILP